MASCCSTTYLPGCSPATVSLFLPCLLQSLGMSSEQMYRCLVADPTYSTPAALPRLSECWALPAACLLSATARTCSLLGVQGLHSAVAGSRPHGQAHASQALHYPLCCSPRVLPQRRWPRSGWARA